MMLPLLWLLGGVMYITQPRELTDAYETVRDNFFGSCDSDLIEVNKSSLHAFLSMPLSRSRSYYVFYHHPAPKEVLEYESIPPMLSIVHPNLTIGFTRGRPAAHLWAVRKEINWQLAKDHPRTNKTNCLVIARNATSFPNTLYSDLRRNYQFYLLRKKNVLIHETGIVGSHCGYFQIIDGCETRYKFIGKRWWHNCRDELKLHGLTWDTTRSDALFTIKSPLFTAKNGTLCKDSNPDGIKAEYNYQKIGSSTYTPLPWTYHPKVFLISALWDSNYHHFLIDSFLRLIRCIDFLKSNPDIKVHIRESGDVYRKKPSYSVLGAAMREKIFNVMEIDPKRQIWGPVIAGEVFIPRAVKCNYEIGHGLEVR